MSSRVANDLGAAELPRTGDRLQMDDAWIEVYARAHLPTRLGVFELFVFRNSLDDKEHVALARGAVLGRHHVTVRLHSECLTGDVLGSLRCDCRDQLELAMGALGEANEGLLLYLRQEGRGIGLGNKIRAYALQERGLDTIEANEHLGFDGDLRDYRVAALILRLFGVASVQLVTNNPGKIDGLRSYGVHVAARAGLVAPTNPHNAQYLATKASRAGHLLAASAPEPPISAA
ncbi:MAG: GTP cyclohydrolase II [Myxococcota bacterium]